MPEWGARRQPVGKRLLDGWQEKHGRKLVRDRPRQVLLDESERAPLRGRSGFAGMLLGSTSQALLHHSSCPEARR
ncbi:universal stress protein [Amycolatopsis nivea]|uniref:universal stress protein n=1 Tax=Amycolatopsis nivea TaxID=1644109 RepID=UPI003F6AE007